MPRKQILRQALEAAVRRINRKGAEFTLDHNSQGYRLTSATGRDYGGRLPATEMIAFLDGWEECLNFVEKGG